MKVNEWMQQNTCKNRMIRALPACIDSKGRVMPYALVTGNSACPDMGLFAEPSRFT